MLTMFTQLYLVLLLCAVYPPAEAAGEPAEAAAEPEGAALKELHLMGFMPMTGAVWPGGRALLPAMNMAVRHVNARQDVLPGYSLDVVWKDDQCMAGICTNALYHMLYTPPVKHMILGPTCSTCAEVQAQADHLWNISHCTAGICANVLYDMLFAAPVKHMILGPACSPCAEVQAQAVHLWNISHFSFAANSPVLSDKRRFPRFFRINPPDTRYNLARLALFQHFNWKKVATINIALDFFSAVMEDLVKTLEDTDIKIITQEIFDNDPTLRVQNLKNKDARIILSASYEDTARLILCAAYKLDLYAPKTVWMFPGWYADHWWRLSLDKVPCTLEEMDIVAEGTFYTGIYFNNPNNDVSIGGMTPAQFGELITREPDYEPETKIYEFMISPTYDTVWGCALALNCTVNTMREKGYNKTLDEFEYSDGDIGDIMTSCIYNVSFMGLTGAVKFDRDGEPMKNIKIDQIQEHEKVTVGTFVIEDVEKHIVWHNGGIRWKGGVPPRDSTQITWVEQTLSVSLYVAMSACATFGNVLAITLLVFNIIHRDHVYVKLSSPNINNVLVSGCILAYSTVYMYAFHGTSSMLCKLRHFTFTIGFTMAFGAMFSKTWRVYKIFCNKKLLRVKINDVQLIGIVVVLVVLMLAILIVWELVDPLFIRTLYLENQKYETGNDAMAIPYVHSCTSDNYYYFLWSICIVEGVMLAFGAFLSFETRKIRIEALNDARQIGLCLYNVIILSVLVLILSILLDNQVALVYGIFSGFVILGTTTTLLIIFVPKIQSVFYPHTVEAVPGGSQPGTRTDTVGIGKRLNNDPKSLSTLQSTA